MRTLTFSELESEAFELLPDRETLSVGNNNWASVYASNSSMALNAASAFSEAESAAFQSITVHQH
jgi:hypothetical protein